MRKSSISTDPMKSSAMLAVLFGISSGLGFAATSHFLSGRKSGTEETEHREESPTLSQRRPLQRLRQSILGLLDKQKSVDWSTILILYTLTLTQVQPRARSTNTIAIPCLYLLLRRSDDSTNTSQGHSNNDSTNENEDEQLRNGKHDQAQPQPQPQPRSRKLETEGENYIEIPMREENNRDEHWELMGLEASQSRPLSRQRQQQQQQQQEQSEKRPRSDSVLTQTSENGSITSSTTATQTMDTNSRTQNTRYLEMLVHNVSHTDLVLCLGIPEELQSESAENASRETSREDLSRTPRISNKKEEPHVLCRPRFSAFDMFCTRILNVMQSYQNGDSDTDTLKRLYSSIMSFPSHERSDASPRFALITPRPSKQSMLPVGFNLSQLVEDDDGARDINAEDEVNLSLTHEDLSSLRMRGRDMLKMEKLSERGYLHSPRQYFSSTNSSAESGPIDAISESKLSSCNVSSNENIAEKMPHLEAIFFPLLSSLLRRWHKQIANKFGNKRNNNVPIKKVLILVSGVGTPRNWTHSISGNSTEACAKLMEIFINVLYPDVTVVKLHSQREIFRYDENITFANKELLPCIDAYRDAHARGERYPDEIAENIDDVALATKKLSKGIVKPFDTDWKQTFSVTLSFADGAPARTHAIQSSLRPYRPTYFHFWQLKTFWHDSKICDDDIEVHSFESMETVPAMEVQHTHTNIQKIVQEMKEFRQSFLRTLKDGDNDLKSFWLRKTKKPVLAVLGVRNKDGTMDTYRGTNMEVSMPTGSLCAERNVIGSALARNPGLRREDLMIVAVLAVPLSNEISSYMSSPPQIPSPPPGSSNICTSIEAKHKDAHVVFDTSTFISEVEEKLSQYQRPENFRRSMSIGSFASIMEGNGSDESDSSWDKIANTKAVGTGTAHPAQTTGCISNLPQEIIPESKELCPTPPSGVDTPIRKIQLHGGESESTLTSKKKSNSGSSRRRKKTVLVHSPEDINPLRPCGSCNEWLKKIAESNPYFKVVTFTDYECNGVYVAPCQE